MSEIQVLKRDGNKDILDLEKLHKVVFYACENINGCLLYTSPSPRDVEESRMPSSA